MFERYNQQPTLLIGLGGFGSKIVDNIYGRVTEKSDIMAFAIDTDVHDARSLKSIPEEHFVNLVSMNSIPNMLFGLDYSTEWFPKNTLLTHKTVAEGAGQIRAVARAVYEYALQNGAFKKLLDSTYEMARNCHENGRSMRVSVVTSLVGGTGSGIFIQTALLIRKYIAEHFPLLNVKIHGEFILPSNFLFIPSKAELHNLESNAYASLKELNAINEHFFSNAPAVELTCEWIPGRRSENGTVDALPYDYCFLYDRENTDGFFFDRYIEDAVFERLFGASANEINEAFVDGLRTKVKKRSGNLYGITNTEILPANTRTSEIYAVIKKYASDHNGKNIVSIRSAHDLGIDHTELPNDVVLTEQINEGMENIVITVMNYGVEISRMKNTEYQNGRYYYSYKAIIDNCPPAITPHLDRRWAVEMADIGMEIIRVSEDLGSSPFGRNANKDAFVFISYSTKESEVAEQTKRILEANGISCWMAPKSIPAGSDYAAEIPKAIGNCSAFLLILSKASQESNWVPKEVGLAIGKGKIVVPFQIDNEDIIDSFNFYLTNSQRISAYNRMTEAYRELAKRLIDIIS